MGKQITIVRDSREKKGWIFEPEKRKDSGVEIMGTIVEGLETGDYQILSMPELIAVERKAGIHELIGNYTPAENKECFEREMERFSKIKYKYLIIETNLSNDVLSLGVPQIRGLPIHRIVKWICSLQQKYGIVPIFAGDCGQRICKYLFEEAVKNG